MMFPYASLSEAYTLRLRSTLSEALNSRKEAWSLKVATAKAQKGTSEPQAIFVTGLGVSEQTNKKTQLALASPLT